MLDIKTLKVLEFLNEHQDESFSIYQMDQNGITATYETLNWLVDQNMVLRFEDEEPPCYPDDGPEYLYMINAGGRQALEIQRHFVETEARARNAEARANVSLMVSKLSLVIAVIAIIVEIYLR